MHARGSVNDQLPLSRAKEIAREVDAELDGYDPNAADPSTPFANLLFYAIDPQRHQWSKNWSDRVLQIANYHLLPAFKGLECRQLDRTHMVRLFDKLQSDNYSASTMEKTRQILVRACEEGVAQGIWSEHRHPMAGVVVPITDDGDGSPDLAQIPTEAQFDQLIKLAERRPIHATMIETLAYTGVRWGELLALRRDVLDLENRRMTVNLVCVEDNKGKFQFQPPSKTGRAKKAAKAREVVLESRVVERLASWLDELEDHPGGQAIEGAAPTGLLFWTRNGNPFRRSSFNRSWWRYASEVPGWPQGASPHYARHYYATRLLTYGVEVPTAAAILGHRVETFFRWYVGTDAEALSRAETRIP